ncbi:hypothetical protein JCM8097_004091 [Rhodosporidiobolus ruineniae]
MQSSTSAGQAAPPKARRSQFIEKLHDLLENPLDPESLRWTPDGTAFEITNNEAKARNALSPKWDFRSLSSFIRQLSYYNFKRLSDRRRSADRRASTTGFIVFNHPSGVFVRGDASQLDSINRKARQRPDKDKRKMSTASTGSADEMPGGAVPWPGQEYAYQQPQAGPSFTTTNPFAYASSSTQPQYYPPAVPGDPSTGWRPYESPSWPPQQAQAAEVPRFNYTFPSGAPAPQQDYHDVSPHSQYHTDRRGSLSEYKVGPGVGVSPRSKPQDLQPLPAGSYYGASAAGGVGGSAPVNVASPYPTPTYTSHLGLGGVYEQPHFGSAPSDPSPLASSSYRPTGLPMVNPRGSISAETVPPPSIPPPQTTYTPYPALKLQPPSLPSLYPHLHHPHPQHPSSVGGGDGVLPSPTYSSAEDEPHSASSLHGHQPPPLAPGSHYLDQRRGSMHQQPPPQQQPAPGAYSYLQNQPQPSSPYDQHASLQPQQPQHDGGAGAGASAYHQHQQHAQRTYTPSPLAAHATVGAAVKGLGWAPPPPSREAAAVEGRWETG